tara:strand:- start:4149 stop:4469 length:321 start_codon:yes stop_codon:yes gene_type:complete
MKKSNCPNCNLKLRKVSVKVAGAKSKAVSFQCKKCDYFEFEQDSSQQVLEELRDPPLKIQQRIVKLSHNRLGIYFNKNIINSLGLTNGEEILVSVPDKKHIVLKLQ